MKKLLLSIVALGSLSACYEDKGNYDYHFDSMNEIKQISFIPEAFTSIHGTTIELQQPLTEAETKGRIEVKLDQSLSKNFENLDFTWIVSHKEKEDDKDVVKKDTVYTKGYLEVDLKVGEDTKYDVLLEVKDNTTSLSKFEKVAVVTRPIYKNSWFVLHGKPGNAKLGNVEKLGAETKVRMDAYQTVHPDAENPFKLASCLAFAAYMHDGQGSRAFPSRMAVFSMDGSAPIYDPYGMKSLMNPNYVLPVSEKPIHVKSFHTMGDASIGSDYKFVIAQDGRFYWSRTMLHFKTPGEDSQDPNHLKQDQYAVEAGTVINGNLVFWDRKEQRFITVPYEGDYYLNFDENRCATDQWNRLYKPVWDAHVNLTDLEKKGMSPKGKKAVYAFANYKINFDSAPANFIFQDEESGKYYLYELTSLDTGDKKTRGKDDKAEALFSIQGKELVDFTPSRPELVLYDTWFTTNYLFVAEGGIIYRYNTNNGDKVKIYEAPEGYQIAKMKPRSYDVGPFMGDLGLYMVIGMNKGEEGAITEIKLATSGDLDPSFKAEVYSQDPEGNKFGNIMDVQFAYEYMYKTLQQ